MLAVVSMQWGYHIGAGLIAIALPFRAVEIGLTTSQLGTVVSMEHGVLLIVLAPAFVMLRQSVGASWAIASVASVCACGCAVIGWAWSYPFMFGSAITVGAFASGEDLLVTSYVMQCTEPAQRAEVMTSLVLQYSIFSALGNAAYRPYDMLLSYSGLPAEYHLRATMELCPGLCVLTIAWLVHRARFVEAEVSEASAATWAKVHMPVQSAMSSSGTSLAQQQSQRVVVMLCLSTQCLMTMFSMVFFTMWPVFTREHFGWGPDEYSQALLLATISQTSALFIMPKVLQSFGAPMTVWSLSTVGLIAGFFAFILQDSAHVLVTVHVSLACLFKACVAAQAPGLTALASNAVSNSQQTAITSVMSVSKVVGSTVGGVVGSRLYQISAGLGAAAATALSAGGRSEIVCPLTQRLWCGGTLPLALLLLPCLGSVTWLVRTVLRNAEARQQWKELQ